MQMAASSLLAVLAGGAAQSSTEATNASAAATSGDATGFAGLLLSQTTTTSQVAETASALVGQTGALATILPKLEAVLSKLNALMQDPEAAGTADLPVVLRELAGLLTEIDQLTDGGLTQRLEALAAGLGEATAEETEAGQTLEKLVEKVLEVSPDVSGESTDTDVVDADTVELTPDDQQVLVAAVLEVATAVRTEVQRLTSAPDVAQQSVSAPVASIAPQPARTFSTPGVRVEQAVDAVAGQAVEGDGVLTTEVEASANTPTAPRVASDGSIQRQAPVVPATATPVATVSSEAQPVLEELTDTAQETGVPVEMSSDDVSEDLAFIAPTQRAPSGFESVSPNARSVAQQLLATSATSSSEERLIALPDEIQSMFSQETSQTTANRTDAARETTAAQRGSDANQPRFAAALLGQVKAAEVREGTTRIELTPRGLGSIEVELKTNSDGSLAVVVRAENSHVLSSLREERDLLALAIGDTGTGALEFQEYTPDNGREQQSQMAFEEADSSTDADVTESQAAPERVAQIGGRHLDLMT
jgi:hypothetical protein